MNKTELIDALAKDTGLTKKDCGLVLDAFQKNVTKAVAKGDKVALIGFETFSKSKRSARTGKNPQTGATIKIAATTVPKFKPGSEFKAAVAKKKK